MKEILWHKVIDNTSFPFEVKDLRVVQTHISYIFITDTFVYKVKKPVNFGFLDYTTLEKRRHFCEKEVILNKRLCPDLYLGVVSIVEENGKYKFEGEGKVVEYAVKMLRLPEEGMMIELLKNQELKVAHLDLIVSALVPFYKTAETGEKINQYGDIEVIRFNTEENFEQTKDFVGTAISEDKYLWIVDYTRNFIRENKKLFEKRIKDGYIRDGHGDLYSANICFDNLKKVYIFDCIEFNERFRCGDVCSDIAFLAMDLDFHRFKDLSNYFIEEYIKKSEDKDLKELLNFYKCYRAYVRGKIGCFTYASKEVEEKVREEALENAKKYFDLAYHYAEGIPKVIVFFGLSGTGKTFLSQNLLKLRPAYYLSSDVIRKTLLGLDVKKHYYAEFEKGIYSPEITEQTYLKMIELAKEEVSYGRDVILDATFRESRYRLQLMERFKNLRVKFYWIWCEAEDEIIKERLNQRKHETTSDALWEIYQAQKKRFEPPLECSPLLKLDTSKSLEVLLNEVQNFLKK